MSIAMRTDPSAAGTAPRVVAAIQEILCEEAEAIVKMANALPHQELSRAVTLILECTGHIVVTGLGKAGLIGQKIAATLASTGTPSYFLHPSEALHGDLGCLRVHDVILALSSSGETVETVRTTKYAREQGLEAIAMTGRLESPLARSASCILPIGGLAEAGTLRLAPSSSTTCMLALGD